MKSIVYFFHNIITDAFWAMTSQSINISSLKRHTCSIPFINVYTLAIHNDFL